MRRLALATLACVTLLGFVAAAQAPPRDTAAAPPPPTGLASLTGVVVDGDNRPLRRAIVSIAGALARTTLTDDAGQFTFSALPAGRFTITASKPGYPDMSYGAKRAYRVGSGLLLAAGERVDDIRLTLARGGVLTGTVFDQHGQPLPNVALNAWEVRTTLAGERTANTPGSGAAATYSDDRGHYRIYGLPPGEYTVGTSWFYSGGIAARVPNDEEIRSAFAAAQSASTRPTAQPANVAPPPTFAYTPVYHPSALDMMAATTVTLGAGEERSGIDVRMQFKQMSRIEGSVIGLDGRPKPGARLTMSRRNTSGPLGGVTSFFGNDVQGHFRTSSLPAGEYTLSADVPAENGQPPMWATADVTLLETPATVMMSLQPSLTLAGRLVFEGAVPPPTDLSRIAVTLFPVRNGGPRGSTQATVPKTDAAGNWSITGVMPGQYRITVTIPAGTPGAATWNLRSVATGNMDITDVAADVGASGLPPMTVTLTDQASELSGTLQTGPGERPADYFVVLGPADQKYWVVLSRRIQSTRPDQNGRYVFRNLPPGDYRVAATTDLVNGDLQDNTIIAGIAQTSAAVTLGLGEKKTFDFRIAR